MSDDAASTPGASSASSSSIFFFWHDLSTLPPKFEENSRIARALHPGWTVTVIDDARARAEILEYDKDLHDLYCRIRVPACRSDIARLVLLHRYGGWYVD